MDAQNPHAADQSAFELKAIENRVKEKDSEALAIYIQHHRVPLTNFIRSITGARLLTMVELEDILQEVSATALQGLATAPFHEYEPLQWLQQLARRRVVDVHRFHFDAKRRDAGRQQSLQAPVGASPDSANLEHLLAASMTSPSAAVSQDNRLSRMQQSIQTLSEEQQLVVKLRYVDGLPTKQIAEQIGKTDVAVRVLLSRSMKQLEKLLEDVRPTRS